MACLGRDVTTARVPCAQVSVKNLLALCEDTDDAMMVRGAEGLECFDEAEDWAVACQHYSMTCAATEDMATLLNASGCVEHCFRHLEVGDACTDGGPVCTEARGEVDGGEAGQLWGSAQERGGLLGKLGQWHDQN